jgi:hypothetical protein
MEEQNNDVVEETTEQVEETTEQIDTPIEEVVNKIDESKFDSAGNDDVFKIDLSKPPPEIKEENTVEQTEEKESLDEVENDTPTLQDVTEEKTIDEEVSEVEEEIEEAVTKAEATGQPLPENIQKLVDFMEETGGDLNDYVNLNRDISKLDDSEILDEYYRSTKSHLSPEERSFLLEDTFGFDEEVDEPRDVKKKKIALKEQVAEAKAHLDGQKSKYYEDIKSGSRLTSEQQKAIDFFNRYNKESEEQKKLTETTKKTFLQKTDKVFNDDFKGFDYQVGDKKFRFNVKDANKVKQTQSDLNNFINKFVGEDNTTIKDAKGYHKSLFTAMNSDAIANHFYEQGKADAIKGQIAKSKNINTNPRQTHGETNVGGVKYRVLGDSSTDLKNRSFKIRKKN